MTRICAAVTALALQVALTPQLPAAQQSVGQATIEGVVRANSGEPIAGARVTLSGPLTLTSNTPAPPQTRIVLPPGTTTNSKGEFSFEHLRPGSYRLSASADGFDPRSYGQESRSGLGILLSLVGNERVTNATIQLPRLGAIAGRIIDEESRRPLENVPVEIFVRDVGRDPYRTIVSTVTDDRGAYRLFGIAPGAYYLRVGTAAGMAATVAAAVRLRQSSDGSVPASFKLKFFPGVITIAEAVPIDVLPGAEIGIDMTTVVKRLRSIRGSVKDSITNRPPETVQFRLIPTFAESSRVPTQTYDPATGAFELRNVPEGSYTLRAQSRVLDDVARTAGVDDPFVTSPVARVPIEISDRDLADVALSLRRPVSVSGRFRLDGVAGRPLPYVTFLLEPVRPTAADVLTTSVGSDGTFRVHGLINGQYRPVAGALGFYVKSIRYAGADILNSPWSFSGTEADPDGIEIVLGEGSAQVSGTVTDSLSQPVGGAQVILLPEQRERRDLIGLGFSSTDQYGRFNLPNIPPGNYKLFAWAPREEVDVFNPEYVRKFETLGCSVSISASSAIQLDVRVIPSPAN